MQKPNYRVWQVDDLQLSTAPPRSLSYNLDIILYWDMTNFSAKGEGLWRNFAISATQHTNCLDFPFELPLVPCLYYALLSNYIILLVGADCTLDRASKDLQGIHVHKLQFTP